MRSFRIVDDPAFHRLMKTGRPHTRTPSSRTVACDVHIIAASLLDVRDEETWTDDEWDVVG